jgi:hypothetical protein
LLNTLHQAGAAATLIHQPNGRAIPKGRARMMQDCPQCGSSEIVDEIVDELLVFADPGPYGNHPIYLGMSDRSRARALHLAAQARGARIPRGGLRRVWTKSFLHEALCGSARGTATGISRSASCLGDRNSPFTISQSPVHGLPPPPGPRTYRQWEGKGHTNQPRAALRL